MAAYIYSEDPVEEARMLAVRDAPDRVVAMVHSRAQRRDVPLTRTELVWLEERFVTGVASDAAFIPVLHPAEWHTLTRALLVNAPVPARESRGLAAARRRRESALAALVAAEASLLQDADLVLDEVCPPPVWTRPGPGRRCAQDSRIIARIGFRMGDGDWGAEVHGAALYALGRYAHDPDPRCAIRRAIDLLSESDPMLASHALDLTRSAP